MIHFFIDTNVLLSFYAFTQDDLTRLERLAHEVEAGRFVILTTSLVQEEFTRNRDAKIADTRKQFTSQRLDFELPRLCDPYDETATLRDLARQYSRTHGELLARIDEHSQNRALVADQLVDRFFAGATTLVVTPESVERARVRAELGNPPGKRGGPIGDAVNWELLLAHNPPDRLFYVTDDKDFYSPLGQDRPNEFLTAEWNRVIGTPIGFVRRLSQLPEEAVPQDVLPVEDAPDERDELVARLASSGNFAQTHAVIAALRQFPRFTARQVRELVSALDNSQVGWISDDEDVSDFYTGLMDSHEGSLTDEDLALLRATFEPAQNDPEPDLPF